MPKRARSVILPTMAAFFAATGLALIPSAAVVGAELSTPGVPQPGVVVYSETFDSASTPLPLNQYQGGAAANYETYTADSSWLTGVNACNGWIVNSGSAQPTGDTGCSNNGGKDGATPSGTHPAWWFLKEMAKALGSVEPAAYTAGAAANNAVSSQTNSGSQPAGYQFQTTSNTTPAVAGHYYVVSAWFAAVHCHKDSATWYDASETLSLITDGASVPLASGLNPCAAPTTQKVTGASSTPIYIANLVSGAIQAPADGSLGLALYNATAQATGNDVAFDLPQIVDATPRLDKAFTTDTIDVGGTSTLTFTVTNTAELAAKAGWSFTDTLPTGVTATAYDPAADGTHACTHGSAVTAPDGTSVTVGGDLTAGQAYCTVSVTVTSATAGAYVNGAPNIDGFGVTPPLVDATLTVHNIDRTVGVVQYDGTPDPGDADLGVEPSQWTGGWANSLDGDGGNGLVRTNDVVEWDVTVTNGNLPQPNTAITITLPPGVYFEALPPSCDSARSTLIPDPATIPAPSAASVLDYTILPAQTLVCYPLVDGQPVLDQPYTTTTLAFQVTVRPEVPNGTALSAPVTVSSDADQTGVSFPQDVTVVSAPQYDISKWGHQTADDAAPVGTAADALSACPAPGVGQCFTRTFELTVQMPTDGTAKGVEVATGFSFTDDLSPESLWGISGITDLMTYGASFAGVTTIDASQTWVKEPASAISGEFDATTAVRDSGTVACSQPGGPGTPATCTISGGDYTGSTVPTLDAAGDTPVPASPGLVVSVLLSVAIPLQTVEDYGDDSAPGQRVLPGTNSYTDFAVTTVSGDANVAGADLVPNNTKTFSTRVTTTTEPVGDSGLYPLKTVDKTTIQPGDPLTWTISETSVGNLPGQADIDLIDVLPADGVDPAGDAASSVGDSAGGADPSGDSVSSTDPAVAAGTTASTMAAPVTGVMVTQVTGPDDVQVWYTTAAASSLRSDPADPSNSTGPVTPTPIWTKAASLTDIPATATGLRFIRPGPFTDQDSFSYQISVATTGLVNADVLVNTLTACNGAACGTQQVATDVMVSSDATVVTRSWELPFTGSHVPGWDWLALLGIAVVCTIPAWRKNQLRPRPRHAF